MKLVSNACINFVKKFEGFYPNRYKCPAGVETIGYGFTGKEIEGLYSITKPQASKMLEKILNENYAYPIARDLKRKGIELKQNEFDALVSFAYNCGIRGLFGSTLYKNICKGIRDKDIITENFGRWNKGGGKVLAGLVRRRKEESEMFLNSYVENPKVNSLKIRYTQAIQECYNSSTQTSNPLKTDGIWGEKTEQAWSMLKNLGKEGHK